MARIRFAARDPGGANVLVPVIQRLASGHSVDTWALPVAATVFERNACLCRRFDDPPSVARLVAAWEKLPADVLVTGTSGYAPFESALWSAGRERGVPSLAVIDAWCNLGVRFRDGRPDAVAALDARQAQELRNLGFAADQVIVAGHSWLNQFCRRCEAIIAAGAAEPHGSTVQVLFVSEGFAQDVARGVSVGAGFDELDSFRMLWRVAAAAATAEQPVAIVIKFHPYEDPQRFLQMLGELPPRPHLSVRALPLKTMPYPWVLWADLVVGLTSALLLESIVLDRPVISVQPGLNGDDIFVPSARGHARTVRTESEAAELGDLIASASRRAATLAANRRFLDDLPPEPERTITDWVLRMAGAA